MAMHINFSTLLKRYLSLTSIQIRGTTETRWCVADAVRLQVITLTARLSLCASYLPLPPSSSSPCSHSSSLINVLVTKLMVYWGVSTQLPLIKIIGILILQQTLFALLFLRCFIPVHFLQFPLPKKCTPFFCQSSIQNLFSRFSFFYNFAPL